MGSVGAPIHLATVDEAAGSHLRTLIALKPGARYGNTLLGSKDRTAALRAADALILVAHNRTGPTA